MNKIENWEGFVSLAYSHGIFPLVYRTLKEYAHLIPEYIFAHMKQNYMDIVKQNMLMTSELIKVIKILEENGIEAISFKGPVLSQMAYGDVVSRQYCDLDILVKEKDLNKSFDILVENSSKVNLPDHAGTYRRLQEIINHYAFTEQPLEFSQKYLYISQQNRTPIARKTKALIDQLELDEDDLDKDK